MQTIDPFPGHYDASDPFGNADPPRTYGHTGSDWNQGIGGASIPAIAAGVVVFAGWEPTGGNGYCVCVDIGGGLYVAYLHQARDPFVSVGEHVALGEHVGVVGGTGSNARGDHLHITISDSPRAYQGLGNKLDPWQFIQENLGSTPAAGDTTTIGDENMWLIWNTNGDGFLFTPNGRVHVRNESDYNLLFRVITSDQRRTPYTASVRPFTPVGIPGKPHEFTEAELVIIDGYLKAARG